tara:strand:+ start:793 stop:1572 length:780 start_codon:yes stop_codon:yes gene_type:complete
MSHRPNQLENYALQEQYNPRTGNWLGDTKDILLRFLQDLFFQMPRGQGCYHFEPAQEVGEMDEKATEVIISDAGSVNTDSVEKRPAIIISRGPFAYGNTSLDHLLKKDPGLMSSTRVHTDLLSGSFVINCVSRAGLEAEEVAVIVMKAIRVYRRELQKAGFFHIGTMIQIGNETPAGTLVQGDSDDDFVNVPVSFPVYYQESWTVTKAAALLDCISMRVEYVAKQFDGSLLNPASVDINGNPISGRDGVIIQAWTVSNP